MFKKLTPPFEIKKELKFDKDETDAENLLSLPFFNNEDEIKIFLLSIIKQCETQESCEELEILLQKSILNVLSTLFQSLSYLMYILYLETINSISLRFQLLRFL